MNATDAYAETAMEAGDHWCKDFWCVQLAGAIVGDFVAKNGEVIEGAEAMVDETLQDEEAKEILVNAIDDSEDVFDVDTDEIEQLVESIESAEQLNALGEASFEEAEQEVAAEENEFLNALMENFWAGFFSATEGQ